MIRRSPAEMYIRYLLLHPKKYSNEQIREILKYAQLDFVGNWYVDKLREELNPPQPFYPFDRLHAPSNKYLLKTELSWIFHPDDHGKLAFQILKKARVKEFVESMIASNAPHEAIARTASKQYRFVCTVGAIDRYREFFWNVENVDSTELRALLQLRVDLIKDDKDPDIKAQHGAMKRAYFKDARKAAADLPFSPLSALIAQMRMGAMPSRLDLAQILESTRHMAAARSFEAVTKNDIGDSGRAFDLAVVLEKLTTTLKEIVKPDEELREQLAAIAMRTDDTKIPSVHTLSLGKHTVEVAKMETTNEFSADINDGDGSDDPVVDTG